MAHVRVSHGTHRNESWYAYEWVMAHIWVSHVTHLSVAWRNVATPDSSACHICMAHVWMDHSTHKNDSRHTYEWVMAHNGVSRHGIKRPLTHQPVTCEWVTSHEIVTLHVTRVNEREGLGVMWLRNPPAEPALAHTATLWNALQRTATHCDILQRTATHCNTLQHEATYCRTLQHTATHG